MREHDRGFIEKEIHLTKSRFKEAHRLTEENSMRDLKSLLAKQYTYFPRITWHEIVEIVDWKASRAKREGFVVMAIVRIAIGHRLLADFLKIHEHGQGDFIQMSSDQGSLFLTCSCGETLELSRKSLKGMYKDAEIDKRVRRRGETRPGTPNSIMEAD